MSQRTLDAIAKRESAKRPVPILVPVSKIVRKPKATVIVETLDEGVPMDAADYIGQPAES